MFFDQQRHARRKSVTATTFCLLSALALMVWCCGLSGGAAAAVAQPLPPNTGMSLVTNVAGTTLANDTFWAVECLKIPSNTVFIVLDMGAVRDFFKPINAETSYCDMLQANNKHQWSRNGVDWHTLAKNDFHSGTGNGASKADWLQGEGVEGDERRHLSFWGNDDSDITGGCCSTSTAVEITGTTWGQSFQVYYAIQLQPLPPNTGMSLVTNVAGTTLANDTFWAVECLKISSAANGIVVDMGAVRDFFRPVEGATFCEMLQSYTKHQWSADGVVWVDITFWDNSYSINGGSANWWPRDNGLDLDERYHLSFWGADLNSGHSGGCCSSSISENLTYPSLSGQDAFWGQPFTLNYFSDLQPLPPNTSMSLVADVPGTTVANDAFWAAECKKIPSNTLFIALDMGAVRDFFKPINAETSYCEMLQSYTKHQWSADGVVWVDTNFIGSDNNGGSSNGWPRKDKGRPKEKRTYLSFWGSDLGLSGGCCSSSSEVGLTHPSLPGNGDSTIWGQSFTLSYAIQLQPLRSSTSATSEYEIKTTPPSTISPADDGEEEEEGQSEGEPPASTSSSSVGTIVGVALSLLFVAAVVGGLFMMRKKEQSRQRALTRGGGANRQQRRQGRNEQVHNNAAFDAGNDSGNDGEEAEYHNAYKVGGVVYLEADAGQPAKYDAPKGLTNGDDGSGSPADTSIYLAPAIVGDDYEYAEAVVSMVRNGPSVTSSAGPVYAQYAPSNAAGLLGDGHTYAEVETAQDAAGNEQYAGWEHNAVYASSGVDAGAGAATNGSAAVYATYAGSNDTVAGAGAVAGAGGAPDADV